MARLPADLTKQEWGGITPLHPTLERDKRRSVIWSCSCNHCGSIFLRSAIRIREGRNRSCGCQERVQPVRSKQGHSGANSRFVQYAQGANRRGLEFNLSFLEFVELCLLDCHYCGTPSKEGTSTTGSRGKRKEHGLFIANGIDRKDNNIGYTIKNCVPCCKTCNYAKRDTSYSDFISWINKLKLNKTPSAA